jgi:hypothetical protein
MARGASLAAIVHCPGSIGNQRRGPPVCGDLSEDFFRPCDLSRRSRRGMACERKALAIRHQLCSLAALGFSDSVVLLSRRERALDKHFGPVDQTSVVERVEEGTPDVVLHLFGFSLAESSPTGAGRREPLGQFTPAGAATQHSQNALEASAIIH